MKFQETVPDCLPISSRVSTRPVAKTGYTISEVAEASGLTVRALRYYEQIGLLIPQRTRGNARVYPGETLRQVKLVAGLRTAGLDLSELLQGFQRPDPESRRRCLARSVRVRLDQLDRDRQELTTLLHQLDA